MRKLLTAEQRAAEALLLERCRGLSSSRTIELLLSHGLLSHTRIRAFVAGEKVDKLLRGGMKKVEAMQVVAEEMGCSEATVRNYLYYKYK